LEALEEGPLEEQPYAYPNDLVSKPQVKKQFANQKLGLVYFMSVITHGESSPLAHSHKIEVIVFSLAGIRGDCHILFNDDEITGCLYNKKEVSLDRITPNPEWSVGVHKILEAARLAYRRCAVEKT
jgi:hypothetical protein